MKHAVDTYLGQGYLLELQRLVDAADTEWSLEKGQYSLKTYSFVGSSSKISPRLEESLHVNTGAFFGNGTYIILNRIIYSNLQ